MEWHFHKTPVFRAGIKNCLRIISCAALDICSCHPQLPCRISLTILQDCNVTSDTGFSFQGDVRLAEPWLRGQGPRRIVGKILGSVIFLRQPFVGVLEEHGVAADGVKVCQAGVHGAGFVDDKHGGGTGAKILCNEGSSFRALETAAEVGGKAGVSKADVLAVLRQKIDGLNSHGSVVVGIAVDVLVPQHILATSCRGPGTLVLDQLVLNQMGSFWKTKVPNPLKGLSRTVVVGKHLVHTTLRVKGQQGIGIGGNLYNFCGNRKAILPFWGGQTGTAHQLPVGFHQPGITVFCTRHEFIVDESIYQTKLVVTAEGLSQGLDVHLLRKVAVDIGRIRDSSQGDCPLMVEACQLGGIGRRCNSAG